MLDEHGREMHGSWGNMIKAEDAFAQMGADVMRWQFSAQPPDRNLLFGFGPAHEIKRKLLTFWNSVKFLVDYSNIEGFSPSWEKLNPTDVELRPLDRWLVERTKLLVADATAAYEATLTVEVMRAFESFVDDVSNWYIRRSRRRFYSFDEAAFRTLWFALVQSLRVISPVMPFLTDHLWRNLVQDGPPSVHLAAWPAVDEPDQELLREIAAVRRVVELGRQARSTSGLKLRQPLRRLIVAGATAAHGHADEIADELRVKEVEFGDVEASELRVKPNLPVLGPKLGAALRDVRERLQRGEFEELDGGRFQVDGHVLEPGEVLVERVGREGWAVASEDGVTVALDTALDDELLLEARLLDRVHEVNVLRKETGLEITDRIKLWLPDADLVERYADRLAAETLAVSVEAGELRIEKA
jgi:isoleucyl-tRNA synthetase